MKKYWSNFLQSAGWSQLQVYKSSPVQLSPHIIWQCDILCRHTGLHLFHRQPAISLHGFLLPYSIWRAREAAGIGGVPLPVPLDCVLLTALASLGSVFFLSRRAFIWKSLYRFQKAQTANELQAENPCPESATHPFLPGDIICHFNEF